MDPNLSVLVAATVAALVWFALVGVMAVRNRPRQPSAGAETTEMGSEPPAILNLITQGFRITSEAVPATLLDLAARHFLDIELVGGGRHVIRIRNKTTDGLHEFERQVLEHVRGLADDGIVPASALTTGPNATSKEWWKRFRAAVIGEAQRLGFSRDRWTPRDLIILTWAGVPTTLLYAAAVGLSAQNVLATLEDGVVFGLMVSMVLLGSTLKRSKAQRDQPAGLEAAARWLGLRTALARVSQIATLPPSAVAVWDRRLVAAAAMGLAPAAVEGLPLGEEDAKAAWSLETGRWRRVRISYPRFRPGWGMQPRKLLLLSGVVGLVAFQFLASGMLDLIPDLWWTELLRTSIRILLITMLVISVVLFLMAATDSGRRRTATGTVVRLRRRFTPVTRYGRDDQYRNYVALDGGASTRITALVVRRHWYNSLTQGQRVTITMTPRLNYVVDVSPA